MGSSGEGVLRSGVADGTVRNRQTTFTECAAALWSTGRLILVKDSHQGVQPMVAVQCPRGIVEVKSQ